MLITLHEQYKYLTKAFKNVKITIQITDWSDSMSTTTSNVSFRIDSTLKTQADKLFSELGMNMTTAFNIFLRQSVREGCIPFDITINTPNADTIAAMLEAKDILNNPNTKRYSDVEDALKELKS